MKPAFPNPIFIVTACAGGERAGCVVGFATEVSINPPRFLVCISKTNATYPVAMRAARLAVHAVPVDQLDLAKLFGGETGDAVDKFALCDWEPAADGTPLLTDLPTRYVGEVLDRIDLGDHVGHVLDHLDWHDRPGGEQLTMRDLAHLPPGHAP